MLKNFAFIIIGFALSVPAYGFTTDKIEVGQQDQPAKTIISNLIRSNLASVDDHEVIMTKVEMPAGATIPKHTHPTEEFFYVIEGETTLKIDGQAEQTYAAGTAGKIPAETTHSARGGPNGMTIMVFRVHKKGEPERTLIE